MRNRDYEFKNQVVVAFTNWGWDCDQKTMGRGYGGLCPDIILKKNGINIGVVETKIFDRNSAHRLDQCLHVLMPRLLEQVVVKFVLLYLKISVTGEICQFLYIGNDRFIMAGNRMITPENHGDFLSINTITSEDIIAFLNGKTKRWKIVTDHRFFEEKESDGIQSRQAEKEGYEKLISAIENANKITGVSKETIVDFAARYVNDIFVSFVFHKKNKLNERIHSGTGVLSEDEEDRLIADFIEDVTQNLLTEQTAGADKEEKHLEQLFGNAVWEKLEMGTRNKLCTALKLLRQFQNEGNDFDYCCVIICATSALETELKKYFFSHYIEFEEKKHGRERYNGSNENDVRETSYEKSSMN